MSATPAARALVGCLALADGSTLNQAAKLAGYELKVASRVEFFRGRCYRRESGRVVVRNGRIVHESRSALSLSHWMLRLGKKLSAVNLRGVKRRVA